MTAEEITDVADAVFVVVLMCAVFYVLVLGIRAVIGDEAAIVAYFPVVIVIMLISALIDMTVFLA